MAAESVHLEQKKFGGPRAGLDVLAKTEILPLLGSESSMS